MPFLPHLRGGAFDVVPRVGTLPLMRRSVLPEILDTLPYDAPQALRMREDLRRLNRLIGGPRWITRQVEAAVGAGELIAELGAGDGSLAQRIWPLLAQRGAQYVGVDLAPRPAGLPEVCAWEQKDLRTSEVVARADVVVANFVLHHFGDAELRALGQRLHARALFVCEPARRRRFLWAVRLLGPFLERGTRHDARVSIAAGFRAGELPNSLFGGYGTWQWCERESMFGALLCAGRRA